MNITKFHHNLSNQFWNSSDSEPLLSLSLGWTLFLSFLYSLTTILSVVGNVLVILVFVRRRHSATDLKIFLINLAVADLIMAIFCMPFTFADAVFRKWIFSGPMCPIVIFMQNVSVVSSVFINVAIGIDRFVVVTFPLYFKGSRIRVKIAVVLIWTASLGLSCLVIPVANLETLGNGVVRCSELWVDTGQRHVYTVLVFILTYALPLTILSISYSVVGFLLWKRTSPGNRDHVRDLLQLRSKIKVVKMLILVVGMFGICWLPLHIFNLVTDFNSELLHYYHKADHGSVLAIFLTVHWLAMANSFANPFIYSFTNDNFRVDLISLLYSCFPCCVCLRRALPRCRRGTLLSQRFLLRRFRQTNSSSSRSSRSMRISFKSNNNGNCYGGVVQQNEGNLPDNQPQGNHPRLNKSYNSAQEKTRCIPMTKYNRGPRLYTYGIRERQL